MSTDPDDFEAVLDLCTDRHRRLTLATLAARGRPTTLNEAVEVIVEHNHRVSMAQSTDDERDRIGHALNHVHLPKAADAGVIEYDWERQLIRPTPRLERVRPYLRAIVDADPRLEAVLEG